MYTINGYRCVVIEGEMWLITECGKTNTDYSLLNAISSSLIIVPWTQNLYGQLVLL